MLFSLFKKAKMSTYMTLIKKLWRIRKWLLVVIEQIISNSLKYTKEGGLEIYMEGQELCIKDTGIGIKTVMSSESLNVAFQDIMAA